PDPELLLVFPHLPREDRAHEELEERVAPTPDREVRREHRHSRKPSFSAGPPAVRGCTPLRFAAVGGDRYSRTPSDPGSTAGGDASAGAAIVGSSSSSSPTVGVALARGRRRPVSPRSAATSRSRKMSVWPTKRSRPSITKRSAARISNGQFSVTPTGIRTRKTARTAAWSQKQPSPGPRAGS